MKEIVPRRFEHEYPEEAEILAALSHNKDRKIIEWDIKQNGDILTFKTINGKKYLISVEKFSLTKETK